MKTRVLTLLLGTNLGDRARNLDEARRRLEAFLGTEPSAQSDVLETEAVGFDGPPFLNQVLCFPCSRRPETVLRACKAIERAMGRPELPCCDTDGRRIYHSRIIDIDILFYGDLSRNTPQLTLPHPQVASRPFVAELLRQIPLLTS